VISISKGAGDPASDDAHFGLAFSYAKIGDKPSATREYLTLKGMKWISLESLTPLKQLIDAMP
jgi:hypothetical protein